MTEEGDMRIENELHRGLSLKERILRINEPFVLFHTHSATREAIEEAIANGKSMDLDITRIQKIVHHPLS